MEERLFESFVNRTRLCEAAYETEQRWTEVCLLPQDKVLEDINREVEECVQNSFEVRGDL